MCGSPRSTGEAEFNFTHALTKDVAYSQIRRADRAQKHEAAAEWIERLSGERDDKAELLADHYHKALALHRQLGEDAGHLESQARAAFAAAAVRARAVYASEAAARHYHAALQLTPITEVQERARLMLGEARSLLGIRRADLRMLQAAAEAQVVAESWEGAAVAETCLSGWYQSNTTNGEKIEEHSARAARYAMQATISEDTCQALGNRCIRLNHHRPRQRGRGDRERGAARSRGSGSCDRRSQPP